MSTRLTLHLAALLLCALIAGCRPFQVPGLGPLSAGSRAPLEPEATQCGSVDDPVRTTPIDAPIVGAADFHNHQFANLGFGGRMLWGEPFHPDGIREALSPCGAERLCVDETEAMLCRKVACRFASDPETCQAACERERCETSPPHGHLGLTDPVGAALGQGVGHSVQGFPRFEGWPHYSTYTHQQVYHRWLRRAFDGGLKLMVMHAVSNEVLCKFLGHTHPCDDMTNVDLQLQAARDLERFVDLQNDCEENDNGWYRIAESPEQARKIISEGGMAVVLGIEVDTLFNCYDNSGCTEAFVLEKIRQYYEKGVRHVFPVHVFDNAFGGAALYNEFFNFGNAVINRRLFDVEDCSNEYAFRFGQASRKVNDLIGRMARQLGVDYDDYPRAGAHCNKRGLTPLGRSTVQALMDARMIIDIDHMSANMRSEVLTLAEERKYPALVSGHSGFVDLYRGQKRSEGQLTRKEVDHLVGLGGLLAPILHQGSREELAEYPASDPHITHDCGNSAKSFAQAYLYAVDAMKQRPTGSAGVLGVGLGSDFNGLAGMPAPRFGPYACGGDGVAQSGRVRYPVSLFPGLGAPMDRAQAGHRVFDINVDGYAHVGMFPDFIAELRALGLDEDDLRPLFNSAEAYIALWERAIRQSEAGSASDGGTLNISPDARQ